MTIKKEISINNIIEGKYKTFYYFNENSYIVTIDKHTNQINCTCFNGSNMGINNKQICYHKRYILKQIKRRA